MRGSNLSGGNLGFVRRNLFRGLLFGPIGWMVPGAITAGTMPARHTTHAGASRSAQSMTRWNNYFAGALRTHNLHVHGPNALRVLSVSSDGTLPDMPFVSYLEWRHGLSAERFDRFHPVLGPMLERNHLVRTALNLPPPTPTFTPETLTPPILPTSLPPQIPPLPPPPIPPPLILPEGPPQIPEPSSGLIAAILFGAVALARKRFGSA